MIKRIPISKLFYAVFKCEDECNKRAELYGIKFDEQFMDLWTDLMDILYVKDKRKKLTKCKKAL